SSSRKSPGRTEYEAITLERGVTHDTEFERWANKVWNYGAGRGAQVSLRDFRKNIIIELYNEAGQLALAYKVYRCWVSEYLALPPRDANPNAGAIQHIKRENEGGERDLRTCRGEPIRSSPPSNRFVTDWWSRSSVSSVGTGSPTSAPKRRLSSCWATLYT